MKRSLIVVAAGLLILAGCKTSTTQSSNPATITEPAGAQTQTNAVPPATSQGRGINQQPYPGTSPLFNRFNYP